MYKYPESQAARTSTSNTYKEGFYQFKHVHFKPSPPKYHYKPDPQVQCPSLAQPPRP